MHSSGEFDRNADVKPVLKFKTDDLQHKLEPLCLEVIGQFALPIPSGRLLCFFDDDDPPLFTSQFGRDYRGFHSPIRGSGIWPWPEYVQRHFWKYDGDFAFDNAIYLRGDTCTELVGITITLAHGLYHFALQYNSPQLWWANALLYSNLADFERFRTPMPWEIPAQRGAYIAAKRTAETILGLKAVRAHAESRIQAHEDPAKWTFFQGLSSIQSFDLLTQTRLMVEKYKPELLGLRQTKLDFNKPHWWVHYPCHGHSSN